MTERGLYAEVRLSRPEGFQLDVALQAAPGDVVAIVGANGSGKSTLLRALAGLEPGAASSIRLDGRRLDNEPVHVRGIGLVPAEALLLPHLRVVDDVAFGLRARGMRRAAARSAARRLLAQAGLEQLAGRRSRELSAGQAQRVALLRALAVRPRLLLLDEPTSRLDAQQRPLAQAALRQMLAEYDGAALVATHDLAEVMTLADRVLVLDQGHIVQEGTPGELVEDPAAGFAQHFARPSPGGIDVTRR